MVEPKPALPRAVIFDWDNTLVDSWGTIGESMNKVLESFGRQTWTLEEVKTRSNRALRDSFPEWFGADWEKARDIYRDHFKSIHLQRLAALPGADELLRWLGEKQILLFVVSNKVGRLLRLEAEALGWTSRFITMIGSLDAPRDKPARDPVDIALNHAAMTPDETVWFVGDTFVDMECARASGCTPVMVYNMPEAERLAVKLTFRDCPALLNSLNNHI